jgi:phosphatidylglycerophosphate synthase
MPPQETTFAGDKKVPLRSPLAAAEKAFIDSNVDRFPRWIETWHLTYATVAWAAGVMLFAALARRNLHWLWGSSAMIFLQWFTDSFDGAIGRRRDTGLVKWGFYMDHWLDYAFMSCMFLEYVFVVNETARWFVVAWTFLYVGLMISSWLSFACTNQFQITYLGAGPTEVRLLFILINTGLIFFGPRWLEIVLPYAVGATAVMTAIIVHGAQRQVWKMDMAKKAERARKGQ